MWLKIKVQISIFIGVSLGMMGYWRLLRSATRIWRSRLSLWIWIIVLEEQLVKNRLSMISIWIAIWMKFLKKSLFSIYRNIWIAASFRRFRKFLIIMFIRRHICWEWWNSCKKKYIARIERIRNNCVLM